MIRLHHVPESRSMRTLWLLNEIGLDFEVIEWPFDKSLRTDEFLALNPAGRVPALEIDGECLFETGAITEVLCERFSPDVMGRSAGHPERANWLIWVHFAETISQHSAALTQQHVALYEPSMRSPIITKLEARRLGKTYAALEGRLAGREYLLDGGFSAADISVGQALYMSCHFARIDAFANLSAWWERVTARDAYRRSLPAQPVLYAQDFYEPLEP